MASRVPTHQAVPRRTKYNTDPQRRSAKKFYDSAKWKKVRAMKLRLDPLCECEENCGELADEVHHVVPISDRPDLALRLDNLRSMTKSCHSKVTRRETSPR